MTGSSCGPEPVFVMGVGLGQSHDPTAIVIVQNLPGDSPAETIYRVGHIERLPLNTPYPGVVSHVGRIVSRLGKTPDLVIDFTGVCRPVFEMFAAKGFSPIGVSITAGSAITNEGGPVWSVPELTLISTVQALLHDGRLKIQKDLLDVQTLLSEPKIFKQV